MLRTSFALLACCALALFGGCGSSSGRQRLLHRLVVLDRRRHSHDDDGHRQDASPAASLSVDTTPKFAEPPASAPVQSGVVQIAYRNIAIEPDTSG